jgi:phosphoglycolate phosphatase-like HAD superfamily hydrolase
VLTTVVFDADETLVSLGPAIRGALAAVLDDLAVSAPTAGLSLADLSADWVAASAAMPAASVTDVRRAGMARSLARVGLESDVERLLAVFCLRCSTSCRRASIPDRDLGSI